MKITNNFIEGFVTECYAKGLTEKQASWLLDRYIAEGNGEIMEKSAAGKSIINLLLLLLTLGAGAYGLDHLGGTNTAIGKWLKNTLGAGNWGIKDTLNGLFTPSAKPAAPAASAAPAGQAGGTNPAATDSQGLGVPSADQPNAALNNMLPNAFPGTRSDVQNLLAGDEQTVSDMVNRLYLYPGGGSKLTAPTAPAAPVVQDGGSKPTAPVTPAAGQSSAPQYKGTSIDNWEKRWLGTGSLGIGAELNRRLRSGGAPSVDQPNAAQTTGATLDNAGKNMLPIDLKGIRSTMQNLRSANKQTMGDMVNRLYLYPGGGSKLTAPDSAPAAMEVEDSPMDYLNIQDVSDEAPTVDGTSINVDLSGGNVPSADKVPVTFNPTNNVKPNVLLNMGQMSKSLDRLNRKQ